MQEAEKGQQEYHHLEQLQLVSVLETILLILSLQ